MRDTTKFVEINPYSDDFKRMQQFAKTFNHEISVRRNAKLFAFERGEKTFGYADIFYLPIAFPAFHPEVCTPRGVIEVIQGWKTHCEFNHGGEGLIAVPLDETRATFPKEMIEKAGYAKMNREIYELTEGA
jgi:hypothetical protein